MRLRYNDMELKQKTETKTLKIVWQAECPDYFKVLVFVLCFSFFSSLSVTAQFVPDSLCTVDTLHWEPNPDMQARHAAVLNDRNDPDKERQQLFNFFREGDGGSDVLRDGDNLRIELYSIDQRAYDYLFSMQMMENTGTNPIPNFTGGCLGYFSAHWLVAIPFVYHAANVEEED